MDCPSEKTKTIAIVGAGISGLTCALELHLLGFQVEIFEKDSRIGGKIHTEHVSNHAFDVGAVLISEDSFSYRLVKDFIKKLSLKTTQRKFNYIPIEAQVSSSAYDVSRSKIKELAAETLYSPQKKNLFSKAFSVKSDQSSQKYSPKSPIRNLSSHHSLSARLLTQSMSIDENSGDNAARLNHYVQEITSKVGYHLFDPVIDFDYLLPIPKYLSDLRISSKELGIVGNLCWHCGYGYFNDPAIPAFHFLRFYAEGFNHGFNATIHKSLLKAENAFIGMLPIFIENGFGELPLQLASYLETIGVKIHLNSLIERISRNQDGIQLSLAGSDESQHFDQLIISCPSKGIIDHVLENPTEDEKKLMNAIQYLDYCSFLIEFNRFPFEIEKTSCAAYPYFDELRLGHFMYMYFPHASVPVAIVYCYKNADISLSDCIKNFENDFHELYGAEFNIIKVHFQKQWDYMPHFSIDNTNAGYYKLFDSIQGQNCTFYCGGLFNGEMVESCIAFSQQLIRRFFGEGSLVKPGAFSLTEVNLMNLKRDYLSTQIKEAPTILHSLYKWAKSLPAKTALAWYEKGKRVGDLSYCTLWNLVTLHAVEICKVAAPGDRVALIFEPGLSFYVSFYACLLAGMIAVPYYPPNPASPQKGIDLLGNILVIGEVYTVLLSDNMMKLKSWRGKWPTELNNRKIHYLTVSTNSSTVDNLVANEWEFRFPHPADLAFLQFTSGSTGNPKGVIIGHDNLQYHSATSGFSLITDEKMKNTLDGTQIVATSWLPQYHDMGLALSVTTIMFLGGTCHAMSPFDFLADPLVWMDVMSETKSTSSVAPNFAYGLVARKWNSDRAASWELSALRMLGNSSEPILHTTVTLFIGKMKEDVPSFRGDLAYLPGYGMAESVASVGSGLFGTPLVLSTKLSNIPLIASIPNVQRFDGFAIISTGEGKSEVLRECEEGEIWISSPGVARGYWNDTLLTEEVFRNKLPPFDRFASTLAIVNAYDDKMFWLRTGDLGYMENGHLFISGRSKDLIIVQGKNIYPQDIEQAVMDVNPNAIRPGCVIAFAVCKDNTEGFVIVAELREAFVDSIGSGLFGKGDKKEDKLFELYSQIQQQINTEFPGDIIQVVFIKERAIPKTTSGKLKRNELKKRWESASLDQMSVIYKYPFNSVVANGSNTLTSMSIEYQEVLSWVPPIIERLILDDKLPLRQASSAQSNKKEAQAVTLEYYFNKARRICSDFKIFERDVSLINQGLDSFHAFELIDLLNKQGSSTLDVADFNIFSEWTGYELIFAICGVNPPDNNRNHLIFPLSKNMRANLPNLFFIHSLGGYATFNKILEDSLSSSFNIYGVNSPNMKFVQQKSSQSFFFPTFEALATYYVKCVKEVAPKGPYCLGGYCIGGVIAMEMSRQLLLEGDEISFLFLTDPRYNSEHRERIYFEEYEILRRDDFKDFHFMNELEMVRFIQSSFHLNSLLYNYRPATPLIRPVSKIVLLRAEGLLTTLIQQEKNNFQWEFSDLFGGVRSFLHPNQKNIHIGTMFSGHFFIMDSFQKEVLNGTVSLLLHEESREFGFHLNDTERNILIAVRKNSVYLVRILLMEDLTDSLISFENYEGQGKTLLHIAIERQAFEVANFLLKETSVNPEKKDKFDKTAFDYLSNNSLGFRRETFGDKWHTYLIHCFTRFRLHHQYHQLIISSAGSDGDEEMAKGYELTESAKTTTDIDVNLKSTNQEYLQDIIGEFDRHIPNLSRLGSVIRERFSWRFLHHMSLTILHQCPNILAMQLFSLIYRLLMIRIISSPSSSSLSSRTSCLNILAASILDDNLFILAQEVALLLTLPNLHYLMVAVDRRKPSEVKNVFHGSVLLTVIPVGFALLIYCCVAKQIGDAIGIESDVTREWSLLAFTRIIGILPFLLNICMESVYVTMYHRPVLAWGMFVECVSGLISGYQFQTMSELNGTGLGISLSIGSWSKFVFYLLCFHFYSNFFAEYRFFSFSGTSFWNAMLVAKRMWRDLYDKLYSPIFMFSNPLVIVLLLSSKGNEGAISLVIFAIANAFFRIVNMAGVVIGSSTNWVSFRSVGIIWGQMKSGFSIRVLGLILSVLMGFVFAIPLFLISGEEATKLIIRDSILDGFDKIAFYEQVRKVSKVFITIGLLNTLIYPLQQFLFYSLAVKRIQTISGWVNFLVGNLVIIVTFFAADLESYDLIAELCGILGLGLVCYAYEWLRISDYQILFSEHLDCQTKHLRLE